MRKGRRFYVFGGGSDQLRVTYNLTQIYDVQRDVWVTGEAMPICRFALGACVSNQTIYVVGGADNMTATDNVYVLVIESPIPEFPSAMLLLLTITVSLTVGVLLNRKRFRKQAPS